MAAYGSLPHEHSQPSTKSELDLFKQFSVQTAILSRRDVRIRPITSIEGGGNTIEFLIPGAGDDYIDPREIYIHVKTKLFKNSNGTGTVDAADKIGVVNNPLHSLFEQIDVYVNDRVISSSDNNYAYRAYISSLLSFNDDDKAFTLSTVGWKADDPGQYDNFDPSRTTAGANPVPRDVNEGFVNRRKPFLDGNTVEFYGKLQCDLFQQDRLIINKVDIRIKLVKKSSAFCVLGATGLIQILDAELHVDKVTLSPDNQWGIEEALKERNITYPLRHIVTTAHSIPSGSQTAVLDNFILGSLPERLFFACVSSAAYHGDKTKNPFNFHHYDANEVSINVDGVQIPSIPYKLDFDKNIYTQAFVDLQRTVGKYLSGLSNGLTTSDYLSGCTIYGFDLTPDKSAGDDHYNLVKQGNIRIDIRFAKVLPETIMIIVLTEFPKILEIDSYRNVYINL